MEKNERNYSLDLLRIIAMLMIVILHFLSKSGTLDYTQVFSVNNNIAWILESCCIVAVNCYVLISGYFSVNSKLKIRRIINIWGKVIFYSMTIGLILLISGNADIGIKNLLYTFLPTISKGYWFISVYIVMSILSPFYNLLISTLKKNQYRILLFIMIIIFCIIPSFLPTKFMVDISGGTGIVWFTTLYFIAGYIRLHISSDRNIRKPLLKYFAFSLLIYFLRTASVYVLLKYNKELIIATKWFSYNSIFVLLASLYLFLYFKNLKLKNTKVISIIKRISPYTLGVYLIHEQPLLSKILYTKIWHINEIINNWYIIFAVLIEAFITFIICILIDALRHKIVIKFSNMKFITKINEQVNKIIYYIPNVINNICDKFEL